VYIGKNSFARFKKMLNVDNTIGQIDFSKQYLLDLTEATVKTCFGVAGICNCNFLKVFCNFLLYGRNSKKGIYVSLKNNKLVVDIHIEVVFGMNITAITKSIVNKVSFTLEQATSVPVDRVNVYVDNIK
jgi:uncharacterized alkaline shock family protein YloU